MDKSKSSTPNPLLLIVGGILVAGVFFSGLLGGPNLSQMSNSTSSISCCDTGNGADCKAQTTPDKTLTYNGDQYGLIKSGAKIEDPYHYEGYDFFGFHLKDSGEKTPQGDPIVINTSKHYAEHTYDENKTRGSQDPDGQICANYKLSQITGDILGYISGDDDRSIDFKECILIPEKEIVYVCKENCTLPNPPPSYCGDGVDTSIGPSGIYKGDCFGNKDSLYDVYFRLKDVSSPGIPDLIRNCSKYLPQLAKPFAGKQTVVEPTHDTGKSNLQLNAFDVKYEQTATWFSPICKPAIYLYPTETSNITVKIAPKGPLILTIPKYPQNGWSVVAKPNGSIEYLGTTYPYLYYEAQIPDTMIEKPEQGYVIEGSDMRVFLPGLLTKLGLNQNEQKEFTDYWSKALPESPYYFVGIVSQDNLKTIAPLEIIPTPDTTIRVTLYFEALSSKISIPTPVLLPIFRNGYTAVEWGGIFKKHPGTNFSCMM